MGDLESDFFADSRPRPCSRQDCQRAVDEGRAYLRRALTAESTLAALTALLAGDGEKLQDALENLDVSGGRKP